MTLRILTSQQQLLTLFIIILTLTKEIRKHLIKDLLSKRQWSITMYI